MASTARAAANSAREPAQSRPGHSGAARPRLDIVERSRVASRSNRRQANLLRSLGVAFVVGALAITAAAHAFVASDQQRVDTLQGQLAATLAQQQNLQLSRAALESPVRVLNIAERQLGMISPGSVSYLPPVDAGPSVAQVAANAARAAAARQAKSHAYGTGTSKNALKPRSESLSTTSPTG
jgi:cell division protein FtsL